MISSESPHGDLQTPEIDKVQSEGKTVLQDKVKIPNWLQPVVERQARHDADRAGDLQFVENPYAVGGPKFGYNFSTGRQQVSSTLIAGAERAGDVGQVTHQGPRGQQGNNDKKPYVKRDIYFYNRFNKPYPERQGSDATWSTPNQTLIHPKPYFQFRTATQIPTALGQKTQAAGNIATTSPKHRSLSAECNQ